MTRILFLSFFIFSNIFSFNPLTTFIKLDFHEEKNNFSAILEKQMTLLSEDKLKYEEIYTALKSKLESTSKEIPVIKEKIKISSGAEKDFLNKKLILINQIYQALNELEQSLGQIISIIESHKISLQEYKADPEFKNKDLRLPIKSLYNFSDIEKINELVWQYENELREYDEKVKKIANDLSNRQKLQALSKQEYYEKKRQQEEFVANASESRKDAFGVQRRAELLDEEEKLFRYKKELADLKVKETELRRNYLADTQIKLVRLKLQILKEEYDRVRQYFQVDDKTYKLAESELEKLRQDSSVEQKRFKENISGLDLAKITLEEELNLYKTQFNITTQDVKSINDWVFKPTSIAQWSILFVLHHKILRKIVQVNISKEQLEAEVEKERAKISQQEISTRILQTWYKFSTSRGLETQESFDKEIKYYETLKADIQATDALLSEKRNTASINLNFNSKLIDNIKDLLKLLKSQKETVFKQNQNDYSKAFMQLKEAEDDIRARAEPLAHIIELYSQIHEIHTSTLQKVDTIIMELYQRLETRATTGIFLRGLKEFIPDVLKFVDDTTGNIKNFVSNFQISNIKKVYSYYKSNLYEFLLLILQILIILLFYLILRLYLPDLINYLISINNQYGLSYIIKTVLIALLNFVYSHLLSLFLWAITFLAVWYQAISDPLFRTVFYLVSIPFILYYVYKFLSNLILLNEQIGYKLISKEYSRRSFFVLLILIGSTLTIFFFRESFLIGKYSRSQVPVMLLAFNFIILQISLVAVVGRLILNVIPRTTQFGELLHEYINKYYYFIIGIAILIILMSNPYVGYGLHFFNIVSRIILILLLIPLFTFLHNQIRKILYAIFFQTTEDSVKERFSSGKTAYGIIVVASFLFFTFLALIIAANIWGYKIGVNRVIGWLHKELYSAGIDEITGRPIIIMPISFIKVFGFIVFGWTAAYIFNRFVLKKTFDLLLVNIGVQSALLSLIRYFIIIGCIIIGLQHVGLGSSLLYIFAIIGALGVASKELIADFIAYFMILIQRPIKIGDLIMIDDETRGIVRHINFRSVIMRRKNSVTVIIPNSQIMTKPITNWNYSRTFFAFEDIKLTVSYKSDPKVVKELIFKVLDSNFNILKNPAPIIQLQEFTESGFRFMVRGFLSPEKVLDQFDISSDIRIELVRILRINNIDIAVPARTVKLIEKSDY